MALLLGIDVSTTAVKALVINETGEVVASAIEPLSLLTPKPLWSEQEPQSWWAGTLSSLRALREQFSVPLHDVVAIGLTGQMHGLVLLDEKGQVLRPAILWNDQRTAAECDEIRQALGKSRLIELTGNDALAGFTAPKILWVRKHEPDVFAHVAHVLLPKDYVRYRLTGDYATDKADAAGTLLLDVRRRDWSPEVLAALDILPAWLPRPYEGPEITGVVSRAVAEVTGLAAGTPVVGGGGDQAAQAIGVGAIIPGIIALTLGTSGVIFVPTDRPIIEAEGRLHSFCHALPPATDPDKACPERKRRSSAGWHLMGVMLSAAGSLRWYRDTISAQTNFEELLAPAADVPPGAEGLFFLPYLTGERTPHADPRARAAFIGLTLRHTLAHMTRSVLEGVAFGFRDILELMRGAGLGTISQARISGGGARSPLWRQILADVLNCELVTVNTAEGASYGAALLAGVGAGVWPTVEAACAATVRVMEKTEPRADCVALYEGLYPVYRALYPALKPTFDTVADVGLRSE